MNEITNHTQTEAVHNILRSKLDEARIKMEELRKRQREIDLQVEDNARIILSLERSVATLAAALPASLPEASPQTVYYEKEFEPGYGGITEKDEAA